MDAWLSRDVSFGKIWKDVWGFGRQEKDWEVSRSSIAA
jgi:hypothetical protein